jgi:hypothetical protein
MAEDFYTSHCPLVSVNDNTFCQLNITTDGGLISVQPNPVGSIVSAKSAISSHTRRAIVTGCFARLRQLHNDFGFLSAQKTVQNSIDKLRDSHYSFRTIREQVRKYFPLHLRMWRLRHEA